ncbi:MAG: UvrD-helicase domain-containing protein [Candidatus Binatia bacterium]
MTTPTLQDAEARRRAATDLDTTFLVEAGAGTGKTTILVQRLLSIVRSGRGELDRLAAITFTEKAATELRARLYFEIDSALASRVSEQERQYLRDARRQFDRAQLSTVHAFCANLLRERPIEACVDPNFSVLDAFEAGVLRHEVWRDWLAQEMERSPEALKRALRLGVSLEHLAALRDFLLEHRDSLVFLPSLVEDRLEEFSQTFNDTVRRLATGAQACTERTDRAYLQITALAELLDDDRERAAWERLLLSDFPLSVKAGTKTNWKPTKALDEARQLFGALADIRTQTRSAWAHNLTVSLVLWLHGYFQAYEQQKRERGCLDFVDLLLLTRNLLKRDVNVRRYFQRRFRFLLVDEFQDTDPLQVEIIFFLAEQEARVAEWTGAQLQPGKLFLVGDPQQSIYRFRRADLQVYTKAREAIVRQGELLSLSANFRTRTSAISWINETFTREFAAVGGDQPAYRPLQETRTEKTGREVIILPVLLAAEKSSREERRQAEARAVAAFLTKSVGEGGQEVWGDRLIHYRDVAILCRTHQTLEAYEEALREEGVPHRVIGGRRYAQRQEIEELRALLRAIESPSDTAALVATLRSSLLGFSDEELAAFACEGGRLDYTITPPVLSAKSLAERFTAAFALLRDLHARGVRVNATVLLTELYAQTHLLPLFVLHAQGNSRVANLLKLIDTARFLADQGRSTLTALNRFLELQDAATLEGDAALLEEHESAVRLLTIHQAKGLEFPVVILADAAYNQRRASRPGIIERLGGQLELQIGTQNLSCSTLGWLKAEAHEQERDAAEERRLWYVAATRVRDHLVIPVTCAIEGKAKKMTHWAVPDELWSRLSLFQMEGSSHEKADTERADVFVYQLPENTSTPSVSLAAPLTLLSHIEPREDSFRDYCAWESARLATLSAGGRAEAITTVTALSTSDKPPDLSVDIQTMAQRQDRLTSLRFGRAVHAALRSAHVSDPAQSRAFNLSAVLSCEEREEITRLVMETLGSPMMLRARKAEERFAETPFSLYLSGRLVEGVVDFAFIEDGAWVIMDFKTDRVAAAEVETRATLYQSQLCLYALALEQLTRRPIAELALYFVRPQRVVSLAWDDETRRLAETLIDSLPESRETRE